MRRKITALAGVPVLALALTACGALGMPGGGEERQTSAQAQAPSQAPSQAPASDTNQAPSSAPASPAPPQPAQAIANKQFDFEGRKIDVAVTELRREGKLATVHFTMGVAKGERWQIAYALRAEGKTVFNVSGVSLIDTANAKRYRTAFSGATADSEGDCVCSSVQGIFLSEGESHSFYASFAAPPPDVTKINVEIPRFGVFSDVPLS
ncbi:hypothetical protein [Streptosporangium sp. KLBMP 9127]|nr:hypothetical protein [Streptosporangium sp. KLBMP 9127]